MKQDNGSEVISMAKLTEKLYTDLHWLSAKPPV